MKDYRILSVFAVNAENMKLEVINLNENLIIIKLFNIQSISNTGFFGILF